MPETRRILLCSEGHGRGKGVSLRTLGLAFAGLGHFAVAAVPAGSPCSSVISGTVPVVDGPSLSLPRPERVKPIGSYGDLLYNQGFGFPGLLQDKILAWRQIFAEVMPDLVVSDWAPGATLAARGRVPVLTTGNGFYSPPAELEEFPPLPGLGPVQISEHLIRDTVNPALRKSGVDQVERLPALFGGNLQAVRCFSLLDPYSEWRREDTLFAPAAGLSRFAGAGEEIFVYIWLPFNEHLLDVLVEALCSLKAPVRVFSISLTGEQRETLRSSGIIVEDNPVPEREIISRSRLVVHGGGAMMSSLLLAAGLPQVVLVRSVEDLVHANAMERTGACRSVRFDLTGSAALGELILDAHGDMELALSAQAVRRTLSPAPADDWARLIAKRGETLL